jgi:cytochrome c-type biogenesis protein CcmH/NrfG
VQVVNPGRDVDGVLQAREVLCYGEDEGVERAAGRLLTELAGGEPKDVAGDGDA